MLIEDLRAYKERRWDLIEVEKDRARAHHYREGGPGAAHAAAIALRIRFQAMHGEPTPERRRADLAHHIELQQKLDRARDAFIR